jgi:hypothetical protein
MHPLPFFHPGLWRACRQKRIVLAGRRRGSRGQVLHACQVRAFHYNEHGLKRDLGAPCCSIFSAWPACSIYL